LKTVSLPWAVGYIIGEDSSVSSCWKTCYYHQSVKSYKSKT